MKSVCCLLGALCFSLVVGTAGARESVVFVEAHPDDLAGHLGTALKLSEKFDVHIIDFTHGELGCGWEMYTNGWTKATRNVEVIGVFHGTVPPGKSVFDGLDGVSL